jgi:2-dehydro-3-deoxy-D-arabinonate dehydratase
MYLTRHHTADGARWALDGQFLPAGLGLDHLLGLRASALRERLRAAPATRPATGKLLAPIEPSQEVWAAGVTYLRSLEEREAESTVADVYSRVYGADRPEIFFKAIGARVVGDAQPIRVRRDSSWNVPEPELTLVINAHREIIGYCVGNDVSSRDIEGENPLYLPQAKVYDGSCALGPGIVLASAEDMRDLAVELSVTRGDEVVFNGQTRTGSMKRSLAELVDYLARELSFPGGVFLMTGTGIVPSEEFSMRTGDIVRIAVGSLAMTNTVGA